MKQSRRKNGRKRKALLAVRYVRSPFLIGYWAGPFPVIENYLKKQKVVADGSLVSDLLSYCVEPRTVQDLSKQFPETDLAELRKALREMERYGLLEPAPRIRAKGENEREGWESWGPAASYFHFSTKDTKYARAVLDDFSELRKLAKENPLPARGRKVSGAARTELSKPGSEDEFARVLKERRTWREFSKRPLEREQVETLLWLSFGAQGWAKIPGVGRLALKTSPSGGALHPLEAYAVIRTVKGIAPGIYHYDEAGHALERLGGDVDRKKLKRWLTGQEWFCDAGLLVFLTAVFPRSQWKYPNSRAYRVVLAEAGHVCQTFCLTATNLGLAPFCTMALRESEIERALRVDGIGESVMYAMGAGTRPKRPAPADHLRSK